jgi:hypothetical protein
MRQHERRARATIGPAAGYVGALVATAAAGLLRWALDALLGEIQPFATFYVAVTVVAF